jgi:hypothetical protein
MTNSPETRKIVYGDAYETGKLLRNPEVQELLKRFKLRETDRRSFSPGKPGHPNTVEQWTEIYTDQFQVRGHIRCFLHDDGKIVRSVVRIVTDDCDYRLRNPPATDHRNWLSKLKKKISGKAKRLLIW